MANVATFERALLDQVRRTTNVMDSIDSTGKLKRRDRSAEDGRRRGQAGLPRLQARDRGQLSRSTSPCGSSYREPGNDTSSNR
ncbi:hypothetical protein QJS66_00295 [Kocuria rhizophila]|nr:hypothetical protein QJS66_00295 [Kocuria rhizophila]